MVQKNKTNSFYLKKNMQNNNTSGKRLFVYKNVSGSDGKVVCLKNNDSMSRFKRLVAKKLGIKVKKIYLPSGAEIQGVDELQNNDTLYISQGEPFFKNARIGNLQETFSVSVLGSGGVGKSAITLRFVRDYFVKDWDPTIEDAYRKTVEVDGKSSILEILDTAGQDDFESLRAQWMTDKDGYIFVYSMNSRISLHELQPFFELHKQINDTKKILPPIIMVANKKDLVEQDPGRTEVSTEEGKRIADLYNAKYIETSALTGLNINEVFQIFIREARLRDRAVEKNKSCTIL